MSRSSPSGKGHSRMAEPRFNNPYFWPPPPTMPSQLDNLVLINKIKEQLMAEKIRPPHLPPTSASSQQPLLVPPAPAESSQAVMSLPKLQQVPGLHPQAVPQPDVALHARPATSTVTGLGLSSRTPAVSTSESSAGTGTSTPSTPTTTSQSRLIASSPTLISGITSPPLLDSIKTIQGHGLLGPPKSERGRKKIKAENPGGPPVLVVPYPILASGETAKEGKTYRCKVCPLTFFTKSEMQIHSKSHTEAKPHKCPHCSKSFANASYLAQHLRIHLGVKPYHCSYCDKSFRQLSHLQQHTRIHTGDRPYKCPHPGCEKAFTQLSNLQSHQRQHNKDKPYKCPNCYRAYSDSASLQIHLSAHAIKHAKAYCCSMCGRAYTSTRKPRPREGKRLPEITMSGRARVSAPQFCFWLPWAEPPASWRPVAAWFPPGPGTLKAVVGGQAPCSPEPEPGKGLPCWASYNPHRGHKRAQWLGPELPHLRKGLSSTRKVISSNPLSLGGNFPKQGPFSKKREAGQIT